jgi:hypothetical protein
MGRGSKIERGKERMLLAYLALEDAEAALVDVHDRVVDALPVIDNLIIMHSRDDECWSIIGPSSSPLQCGHFTIPPFVSPDLLLGLDHLPEEFNVPG